VRIENTNNLKLVQLCSHGEGAGGEANHSLSLEIYLPGTFPLTHFEYLKYSDISIATRMRFSP
jgi:hypothetical protein